MLIEKALIEFTQDELITTITACEIRLIELRDLYERMKQAGENTARIYSEYIKLKKAIIMLNQPCWKIFNIGG